MCGANCVLVDEGPDTLAAEAVAALEDRPLGAEGPSADGARLRVLAASLECARRLQPSVTAGHF